VASRPVVSSLGAAFDERQHLLRGILFVAILKTMHEKQAEGLIVSHGSWTLLYHPTHHRGPSTMSYHGVGFRATSPESNRCKWQA